MVEHSDDPNGSRNNEDKRTFHSFFSQIDGIMNRQFSPYLFKTNTEMMLCLIVKLKREFLVRCERWRQTHCCE